MGLIATEKYIKPFGMTTITMTAEPHTKLNATATLPPKAEVCKSDTTFLAVYCWIKNYISASGTSTVAIDNKIEQAMDLVKSHLMFAVKEEVDVLKDRITELMDRISQLEYENSILRAHASQETLAQLGSKTTPTNS